MSSCCPELFIKNPEGDVEARPEVVLINSHDGTRPIQFEMGLFRLVCENGLIIKDQDMGSFRERHTKLNFQGVKDLISEKVDGLKTVVSKISQWNMVEMNDKQRYQFAVEALALRLSTDRKPEQYEILDLLNPKRKADEGNTLWKTYNIVSSLSQTYDQKGISSSSKPGSQSSLVSNSSHIALKYLSSFYAGVCIIGCINSRGYSLCACCIPSLINPGPPFSTTLPLTYLA